MRIYNAQSKMRRTTKLDIANTRTDDAPLTEKRSVAVDFDGVCHDYKNPIEGRRMGKPIDGTKEALESIRKKGYQIIIFSVWGNQPKVIEDFMKYYELPYDSITNVKPNASYFIDDKAIRFLNWTQTLRDIQIREEQK